MIKNKIPSIWTGMYAQLPLHEALQVLASQGWRSVEICTEHLCELDTSEVSAKQLDLALDVCVKNNLITLQGHGSLLANVAHSDKQRRDESVDQLKRHLTIASYLGIKNLVIQPGIYRNVTTSSERKRMTQFNVKAFRELGNHAAQLNMMIALKNLPRRIYASSDELLELVHTIDHEAIGVTLESSHAQMTPGLSIPDMIKDFGNHLVCTHLSDNDGSNGLHLIPGRGKIIWPDVMQALADIDYGGTINLEIPGERHPNLEFRDLNSRHALSVATMLIRLSNSE